MPKVKPAGNEACLLVDAILRDYAATELDQALKLAFTQLRIDFAAVTAAAAAPAPSAALTATALTALIANPASAAAILTTSQNKRRASTAGMTRQTKRHQK